MGLELHIVGIRKITNKEKKKLMGKTRDEMERCEYFRHLFPSAPYDSWYRTYSSSVILEDDGYNNIKHMFTRVWDVYGNAVYVIWVENIGYYWHKNPSDREKISRLLNSIGDIDWRQSFHVVSYDDVAGYTDRRPSLMNTEEEIVAFIYG